MTHLHNIVLTFILPDELPATKLALMVHDALHAQACFVWDRDRDAYGVVLDGAPRTAAADRRELDNLAVWHQKSEAIMLARIPHVITYNDSSGAPGYFERVSRSPAGRYVFTNSKAEAAIYKTRQAAQTFLDGLQKLEPDHMTIACAFVACLDR